MGSSNPQTAGLTLGARGNGGREGGGRFICPFCYLILFLTYTKSRFEGWVVEKAGKAVTILKWTHNSLKHSYQIGRVISPVVKGVVKGAGSVGA